MKKIIITYIIIVAVLGCTATFISVRKSDNANISTESNRDSLEVGNAELDVDIGKRKDTIK